MAAKRTDWAEWTLESAGTPIKFTNVSRQDYEKGSYTCIEYWDEEKGQYLIEKHPTPIKKIIKPHGPHAGSKARPQTPQEG